MRKPLLPPRLKMEAPIPKGVKQDNQHHLTPADNCLLLPTALSTHHQQGLCRSSRSPSTAMVAICTQKIIKRLHHMEVRVDRCTTENRVFGLLPFRTPKVTDSENLSIQHVILIDSGERIRSI